MNWPRIILDGLSISLWYEHGVLVRALTRGDGLQGDDVIANIKTIPSIPWRIERDDIPDFFELRGEVLLPWERFEALNKEMNSHRSNIQGQNSYAMQERTMSLKSRSQMLLSAQSLWNRISTGYNLIEEKSQALNAVRLHIAQTEATIKELEAAVDAFVSGLSETERRIFIARYWFLLSVKEIADRLGCTQSKVKTSLFRTRNKLRLYLQEEELC